MPIKVRKPNQPNTYDNNGSANQTYDLPELDSADSCLLFSTNVDGDAELRHEGQRLQNLDGVQYVSEQNRWKQMPGPFPKGTQLFAAGTSSVTLIWPVRSIG